MCISVEAMLVYLVVISNHDDPLQPAVSVLRLLEHQRNESLHLQNLSSLLHKYVVILGMYV